MGEPGDKDILGRVFTTLLGGPGQPPPLPTKAHLTYPLTPGPVPSGSGVNNTTADTHPIHLHLVRHQDHPLRSSMAVRTLRTSTRRAWRSRSYPLSRATPAKRLNALVRLLA
jgi:hypothetical protein